MTKPQRVLLAQPCPYILPDDLVFEDLVPAAGKEKARLRFSRRRGTTLDIPMSAAALAGLIAALCPAGKSSLP
jgi:hypothetical protein